MARLTPSGLDAAAIRDAAERVLSGPAYGSARPGGLERTVTSAVDALARLHDALVAPAGSIVGVAMLAAAVALVALVAWRVARRVRRDRARRATPGRIGGRTARDWERAAERHAADGARGEALRCHYRALVADLVAAGMIDEVAGRTARGYLREVVAAAPEAAEAMTTVTEAFETTWYGRRDVTASDLTDMRAAVTTVRRHLLVPA
ncbi:MAG TPA: DUF4129 domain-containing protein [Euzebyales bacterium]|nr:DUF4129 domain-containing protein [Euzebyales bacterium]